MNREGTLILTKQEISQLMKFEDYVAPVEEAFRLYAEGKALSPGVLDVPGLDGMFHIKAAGLPLHGRIYVAVKVNGNFPQNKSRFGLPTIQGAIVLCDAVNGYPLAILDSIEITMQRTAAATAVAAKYLARNDSKIATIIGCGRQGKVQLSAIKTVLPLERVFVFDTELAAAETFAKETSQTGLEVLAPGPMTGNAFQEALHQSDVVVTCTTSRRYFLTTAHLQPGTFIAAVGADSHDKQEIEPRLLSTNIVVTDATAQCARIGDLHHAVALEMMRPEEVSAELGEVIVGRKPGRKLPQDIVIFDSTGIAIQDVAAAAAIYELASKRGGGTLLPLIE